MALLAEDHTVSNRVGTHIREWTPPQSRVWSRGESRNQNATARWQVQPPRLFHDVHASYPAWGVPATVRVWRQEARYFPHRRANAGASHLRCIADASPAPGG